MYPRKLCLGPFAELPAQLTPPPCSHPISPVSENAILSSPLFSGLSKYLISMLSSLWYRTRPGLPRASSPSMYWLPRTESHPFGRQRIWTPMPGRLLNRPYDCQPFVNQGSIFRCSVGKICTRTPLKNHGVFEETYEG